MEILKLKMISGFWTPLVFVGAVVLVTLVVLIVRAFGEKKYKVNTEQTAPFLSGMGSSDSSSLLIKSENLYWGFMEGLRSIFSGLRKLHSEDMNDFIIWGISLMALIVFIIFAR